MRLRFFLIIFSSLFLFGSANAHPLDLGVLNISGQRDDKNELHVRLELNPQIGAQLMGLTTNEFTQEALDVRKAKLFAATLQPAKLKVGAKPCAWSDLESAKIENPQLLSLEASAKCLSSAGSLELELPFLNQMSPGYHLLAVVRLNAREHVGGADPKHPYLHFSNDAPNYGIGDFVKMGLEHIGVAPSEWTTDGKFHLPKGMDHILFVLALLIGGGTLWNFLKTITGFTLGHTISLALVSFGVLQAGGRWIEASIALTIAAVAGQAALDPDGKRFRHRFKVTFCIGLIHGLGFAAALAGLVLETHQLILAVLGFNAGVEIGQALIVLVTVPGLLYFRRFLFFRRYVIRLFAVMIFAVSCVWFLKRAGMI